MISSFLCVINRNWLERGIDANDREPVEGSARYVGVEQLAVAEAAGVHEHNRTMEAAGPAPHSMVDHKTCSLFSVCWRSSGSNSLNHGSPGVRLQTKK